MTFFTTPRGSSFAILQYMCVILKQDETLESCQTESHILISTIDLIHLQDDAGLPETKKKKTIH